MCIVLFEERRLRVILLSAPCFLVDVKGGEPSCQGFASFVQTSVYYRRVPTIKSCLLWSGVFIIYTFMQNKDYKVLVASWCVARWWCVDSAARWLVILVSKSSGSAEANITSSDVCETSK